MVDWWVGWLVGLWVGWLVGGLVRWWLGDSVGWLAGWLVDFGRAPSPYRLMPGGKYNETSLGSSELKYGRGAGGTEGLARGRERGKMGPVLFRSRGQSWPWPAPR